MAEKALAEKLEKRREAIQSAVLRIEQGSNEIDLHDLCALLVDVAGAAKRDPGIEAAADDVYAAAAAIIIDRNDSSQPAVRKRRLLRDAGLRLQHRLTDAIERAGPGNQQRPEDRNRTQAPTATCDLSPGRNH